MKRENKHNIMKDVRAIRVDTCPLPLVVVAGGGQVVSGMVGDLYLGIKPIQKPLRS